MARFQSTMLSLVLLFVAAFATPSCSPAAAEPATRAAAPDMIAPVTAAPAPTNAIDDLHLQIQADLKKRQVDASLNNPSMNQTASGTFTGAFTAVDGGVYGVTSQSGYVIIDYKTLYPGQDALIGNERVSQGSNGLVANGVTVPLTAASTSSASSSSSSSNVGGALSGLPASSSAASQSVVSTFVSTSTRSMEAASTISTVVTVASGDAHSTASSAAGAPSQGAGHMVAAVGGLLGLMVL